ncbi:hypothetical protein [Alphaproteobacteria bacterium endosymbiont of Tiliacea citrago]|uniref:hypothetical protein n=1 Tax=Alphaproteobacteria bacterium endosymbiont of Tiliacea citrago TaxID=3077944 RepID=UPI00313C3CB8
MNQFYSCSNNKDLLKVLIKKGRTEQLTINVLCKDAFVVDDVSKFLWNNSIPHFVFDDPYLDQNHIFVSDQEMPADMVICFEDCNFKNIYKCDKKFFIGKFVDFVENNEKYWVEKGKKWDLVSRKDFF